MPETGIIEPVEWTPPGMDDPDVQAMMQSIESAQNVPAGGSLGKEEFLNLLVTQLSNQDPLDPMDSNESIAQMAQFSALEQMQNVSAELQAMRHSSSMIDGLLLQGSIVEVSHQDGSISEGFVDKVAWEKGEMVLYVEGSRIPMSDIASLQLQTVELPEEDQPDAV